MKHNWIQTILFPFLRKNDVDATCNSASGIGSWNAYYWIEIQNLLQHNDIKFGSVIFMSKVDHTHFKYNLHYFGS